MFSLIVGKSQSAEGINFQGVARNSNGVLISNKNIMMRLSIIDSSQSGIIIYQEIKSVFTNISGVFSIIIGAKEMNKIVTTGDFYSIEWPKNKFFIKVEIDPDNNLNFILAGTQKLNYVPYAYFAKNVDVSGLKGIVQIGNGGTGTNNLGDFKKQLQIDKVNNTDDNEKPVSKIQQLAIDQKLSIDDTSKMLQNYLRKSDYNARMNDTVYFTATPDSSIMIELIKKYTDTFNLSSNKNIDTSSLSSRIDLKPSTSFVKNYADSVSNLAKIDTSSLSSRIDLKPSTSFVKNYADSVSNLAKIDTSSLSSRIDLKPSTSFVKNYADSVSNLAKVDTSSLSSRIDLKPSTIFVKDYADSVSNLAKVDTSSLSTRINTKASIDSLNQRAFITDVDLKEDKVNKSNNILTDSNSVLKYPTVKSIKGYVDSLHGMTIVSDRLAGSIPSTKLIGTDITKVGTITTGTWNGANIGVDFGGTGTNTLNGILLGNGTGAIGTANYGYFYDTTTQSALLPDKEYAITYNATGFARGITVESNSKIRVSNKGLYNLQFSAQLDRITGNTTCYITIWLRINGFDLPYSSTDITIQGTTAVSATVAAWNFFLDLNANDYVELMWSTTNTNAIIQFLGSRTNPVRPAIPSIILTMHQVY
jgi:hypothetical protein